MLKRFVNKRRMYSAVLDFLHSNLNALASLPALAGLVDILGDVVTLIAGTHEAQLATSTGISRSKEELKEKLVGDLDEILKRARACAIMNHNLVLSGEFSYPVTRLSKMPQNSLTDACRRIITTCRTNLDVLTTYGLTEGMLSAAEQDLQEYVSSLPGPRRAIAARKTATEGLNSLFEQADSTLAKIDALMEVAGFDNEKLLQEYKAVRVITDLKAKATVQEPTPNP